MEHRPQRDEKPFSRKGKIGKPSCSEYITAHCFGLLSTFSMLNSVVFLPLFVVYFWVQS